MKIKSIHAQDIPPIKNLSIENLGSVVIVAGANGSGKSNLKQAIINTFQNPTSPQVDLVIESTRDREEKDRWGSEQLNIVRGTNNNPFVTYMNSRNRGGTYTGNVIQIDSQRSISNVQYQPINLSTPDPDDVDSDSKWYLSPFTSRWQEVVNRIFQKSANRDGNKGITKICP
jgi:ABC-type dipeptide/oligopeptide/nickel transport system ATPase component